MSATEVAVVGGGVIGCAIARELAQRGVRTVVLERDRPGAHASWAAAGMLSPQAEADEPGPMLDLLRRSRALYPELARALRRETGVDVGYRTEGTLLLALTDPDEEELEARHRWQAAAGLPVEQLSAAQVLALEPGLTPAVRRALRFPEDHQVENRLLSRALWAAAVAAGAEVRTGAQARRVLREGDRAVGVELADGTRVAAGAVVVAAGSWGAQLLGLPRPLPVEPVHGQLVALESLPTPFRHVIDSPRAYLVPRSDGRLILGATVERCGFRTAVTPRGVVSILGAALEMAPSLADLPLVDSWAGLRPGTPDGLPILGADPEVPNLLYATGHFRNGILLAPLTARVTSQLLLGEAAEVELEPFSITRF